jgi:ABC-type sugar transport system substrate-binding protein
MKKKSLLIIVLILALSFVFSACGPKAEPEPVQEAEPVVEEAEPVVEEAEPVVEEEEEAEPVVEEEEKVYEVTLILKDNTSAGWRYLSAAAIAAGPEYGINVTEISPLATQDADEQYRIFEDQIEKGVDGIIIAPVDSAGIVPAIERANEAGIPVLTTNTRAFVENEEDVIGFVGVENKEGGYEIAKYMFSQFEGDDPIRLIIINGNMTGQTSIDRIDGIYEAVAEDERVVVLEDQEAKFSRAEAQTLMENLLVRFDEIDLVIALNDEMAIGAFNAIEAAGRLDEILISGFDGAPEGLEAILAGDIVATLTQDLPAQGSEAVCVMRAYLDGEPYDYWTKTGGVVITAENAQEYLDKFGVRE